MTVDESTDRRGRTSELVGFTSYLNDKTRHTDPTLVGIVLHTLYQMLEWRGEVSADTLAKFKEDIDKGVIPPWWAKWDFKQIRADVYKMLTEDGLDEDPPTAKHLADFQEAFLKLETEWRAELAASGKAAEKLGIVGGVVDTLSWRGGAPTPSNCEYVASTGTPCKAAPIPGTTRCLKHGGALIHEDVRRAVLMTSYLKLVEATDVAVNTLVDVAEHGRNEIARVAAAKEILDRAGLTPELEISITLDDGSKSDRMAGLRSKLDDIQGVLTRNAGLPDHAGKAPAAAAALEERDDEPVFVPTDIVEVEAEEKPVPELVSASRFDPLAPGEGFKGVQH